MKFSVTLTFAAALLIFPGIASAEGAAGIASTSAEREAGTGLVATAAGKEQIDREVEAEVEAGTGLLARVDDSSDRQ